jgi:hypothetical protein
VGQIWAPNSTLHRNFNVKYNSFVAVRKHFSFLFGRGLNLPTKERLNIHDATPGVPHYRRPKRDTLCLLYIHGLPWESNSNTDEDAYASITRVSQDDSLSEREQYMTWVRQYVKVRLIEENH